MPDVGSDGDLSPFLTPALLEQLGDAVTVIGADWRYRYVSAGAAVIIGRPADEVIGQMVWDIFPEVVGTHQYDAAVLAMESRTRQRLIWFFQTVGAWFEQHALPVSDGLVILVNDITEQQLAAHRAEQLVKVGETLAGATTDAEVNLALVNEVLPLVGASGGTILIADEERGTMRAVGWHGMAEDFDQVWGEYPLEVNTPSTAAWRVGRPIYVADLDDARRNFPAVAADLERIGRHTVAAMPLIAAATGLGALLVNFSTARRLSLGDRQFLITTAAMAAQALARVRLLAAEQRTIAELQRSLLPRDLPHVDGLTLAARYVASDTTTQIGGDWYDVIPLEGGAVGLVMGDVEGHDMGAAALMGMIRSAVRAYALEGHPPAFVIERSNRFLAGLNRERIVTMSYSQLHPLERLVTTVSAGHPGTHVVSPSGAVFEIPSEVGPPLGVYDAGMRWAETTSTLPEHGLIAMFTDGLVEVRGTDIADGIERVRTTLSNHPRAGPEELADMLLTTRDRAGHDDVALMTGRLTADSDAGQRFIRRLPATPGSVFLARRFATQLLTSWDLAAEQVEAVALVVSELTTNAARHSEDFIDVGISYAAGVLRLEVSDSSHRMPVTATSVDEEETSGRGLLLVEALAARWGVTSDGLGKVVWAEFTVD